MSDNLKEIDAAQLQEILKHMSEMSQRKPPKKKPPRKSTDSAK